MSIFGSLEIGRNSLLTHQTALDVTAHNISQLNTTGYIRQQVNLVAQESLPTTVGELGQGVKVASITRMINQFIETQMERETSTAAYYNSNEEIYANIETVFNEFTSSSIDGTGTTSLSDIINQFWSAWQDVANAPESLAARAALVGQGQTLCQSFNRLSTDLQSIATQLNDGLPSEVSKVNELAREIAAVNAQIVAPEAAGLNPNDLKDKRDQLIKDMGQYVDVRSVQADDGTTTVLAGGETIVQAQYAKQLECVQTSQTDNRYILRWTDTQQTIVLSGGQIKAQMDARDTVVPALLGQVNELASTIIDQVNTLHRQGLGLDGSSRVTGVQFTGPLTANASFQINGTDVFVSAGDTLTDVRDAINALSDTHGVRASVSDSRLVLSPVDTTKNVCITSDPNSLMLTLGIVNNFFDPYSSAGVSARTMQMNDILVNDPTKIAASASGAPGDNTQALAIGALQNATVMSNNTVSIADYYNNVLTTLGAQSSEAQAMNSSQTLLVQKIQQQRESQEGVNLDDELTNMLKYQRGYQSAAKIITTINEMMETLLTLV